MCIRDKSRTAGAPAGHRRGPRAQPRDLANVHYMPGDDPVPVFFDGLTDLTNSFNGSEPVAGDRPRAADRLVEDAFGHGRNLLMEAKGDRRPGGAIATGKLAVHVHLDSLPGV